MSRRCRCSRPSRSLWVSLPDRVWRRMFRGYFLVVSLFTAAVFAVDLALYGYWGFRIDATILIYLSDPKGALASIGAWEAGAPGAPVRALGRGDDMGL